MQSLLFNLYHKNTKKYLSYLIISIRSHFRKWPWRDWQPLYRVGCEFLVCFCRCVGLLRSLLLDWYLGSQKLREILTLLCCITLSSSRENQRSAQEVAHIIRSLASNVTNELVTRWCITERVKRLAGNEIELGMKIPTIELGQQTYRWQREQRMLLCAMSWACVGFP